MLRNASTRRAYGTRCGASTWAPLHGETSTYHPGMRNSGTEFGRNTSSCARFSTWSRTRAGAGCTAQCARLDARRALRLPRTVSTPVPHSGDSSRDSERVETQEPACAGCGLGLVDAARCKAEAPIPRAQERMKARVLDLLPSLAGRVEAIPHPVPLGEGDDSSQIPEPPLRVGFLGVASDPDGLGIFLDCPIPEDRVSASGRVPRRRDMAAWPWRQHRLFGPQYPACGKPVIQSGVRQTGEKPSLRMPAQS